MWILERGNAVSKYRHASSGTPRLQLSQAIEAFFRIQKGIDKAGCSGGVCYHADGDPVRQVIGKLNGYLCARSALKGKSELVGFD